MTEGRDFFFSLGFSFWAFGWLASGRFCLGEGLQFVFGGCSFFVFVGLLSVRLLSLFSGSFPVFLSCGDTERKKERGVVVILRSLVCYESFHVPNSGTGVRF